MSDVASRHVGEAADRAARVTEINDPIAAISKRIFLATDSRYASRIGDALLDDAARCSWILALVQLNIVVQITLLLAAGGLSAGTAIAYGIAGMATVGLGGLATIVMRFVQDAALRRAAAWCALLLMDASLALAPAFNALGGQRAGALFVFAVMSAGAAASVPTSTKLLAPFVVGKAMILLTTMWVVLVVGDGDAWQFVPPILVVLVALWASGYGLHVQQVRTLHLFNLVGEGRDALAAKTGELGRALEAESKASQDVKRQYLMRERFLRFVSHDLRQPVNALGLLLHQLKIANSEGARAEIVRLCEDCVQSADAAIEDVLNVPDGTDPTVTRDEVALQRVFDRLRAQFQEAARIKGLDLRFAPTRVKVVSDERLLERILRNLVGNAIRFTEQGWVLVGVRRENGATAVAVVDTGPGIPQDAAERVFEEGYRLAGSGHAARGYGLGLTIAWQLARAIDATLRLKSQPGRGSEFRLSFGVIDSLFPEQRSPCDGDRDLSGRRVVVVTHDTALGAVIEAAVVSAGGVAEIYCEVDEVEVAAGLDMSDVDIAVVDCAMDGNAGPRAQLDAWGDIPSSRVVLVGGMGEADGLADLVAQGGRVIGRCDVGARLPDVCREILRESAAGKGIET